MDKDQGCRTEGCLVRAKAPVGRQPGWMTAYGVQRGMGDGGDGGSRGATGAIKSHAAEVQDGELPESGGWCAQRVSS